LLSVSLEDAVGRGRDRREIGGRQAIDCDGCQNAVLSVLDVRRTSRRPIREEKARVQTPPKHRLKTPGLHEREYEKKCRKKGDYDCKQTCM
jgi:hypothetical protein